MPRRYWIVGFGMVMVSGAAQAAAPTTVVGSCRAFPQYPTITLAIAATDPGGTVLVCPGSYPEQVAIAKNLTLKGVPSGNAALAVITAPSGGVVANTTSLATGFPLAAQVWVNNSTATITNITVDGRNNGIFGCSPDLVGILYQNSSGAITANEVINQALDPSVNGCQSGEAIFVQSGNSGTSTVNILGNHVQNFQKNGITGNEVGTKVTIANNTAIGQGATTGAAENSIQIAFGAKGQITANVVGDDVWAPDTISQPYNAATGILGYASAGLTITNNVVSNTQYGIAISGDGTSDGAGDNANITGNRVQTTHLFDGIDVCGSSGNTISMNTINGSDERVSTLTARAPCRRRTTPSPRTRSTAAAWEFLSAQGRVRRHYPPTRCATRQRRCLRAPTSARRPRWPPPGNDNIPTPLVPKRFRYPQHL